MADAGSAPDILLVSSREDARQWIQESLRGWGRAHRLHWVPDPNLAVSRARELLPQVLLVDDELGPTDDVHTAITQLHERVPEADIIAIIEEANVAETASLAVLAGARAFVTKPLSGDTLARSIQEVLDRRERERPTEAQATPEGQIIVFCAPKGGTGCTTLAVNTAIGLHALAEEPVVVVDAGYAAPAVDVVVNARSDRSILDLLPRLPQIDPDLISGVLVEHASGVRLLLAPPPQDLANPIPVLKLYRILLELRRTFPWVIVDLGLPLNEQAFAFLGGADRIVVSVLPEMVCLRNTRLMLEHLHERNYGRDKVWVVLNRGDLRGGVSQGDIEDRLGVSIKHVVPDDQGLATHSINRGVPVATGNRRSALGRAYRNLARKLVEDSAPPEEKRSGSLLQRLWPFG
ncbi:MAG: hypothetical protein U9R48_06060 [Chloroflexota bacterium]|nr:hypothetical protein [Chloroflexota bacterium]